MGGNNKPSRLSGSKQIDYILKSLTEEKTLAQIIDELDGDSPLVENWTTSLLENCLIEIDCIRMKGFTVTEDGRNWLVNTGMQKVVSQESQWGGMSQKMSCKSICIRHKAQKPVGSGRYASGQKRCQICEIFMNWPGLWCPCCGYRLRAKPRNLKYKAKLRARTMLQITRPALSE